MPKKEIPPEVRRFILTSIPSVPHIEALILMRATAPARWTPLDLAQRLYVPPAVVHGVLTDLCGSGMLQCDDSTSTYYFNEQPNELCAVIARLALLYSTNLVEITLLIHSKLDRKAQQFADAFNFRKET
ncbi:hypothetical protein PO883_08010 [Massilia sp. DJPM01]|uniref:hypothetical protein n=1 Tax=Massilia sp. DJPM01 TaxID=3024404 RepID=UPI00259E6104|nr:hypothetical protein [Massilia sp. DJPM01]MDM5177139.1 hypothetical protein [Massilia sp. DJPM01]